MKDLYYRLGNGKIWDVEAASYLDDDADVLPEGNVMDLVSADGQSDEEYLIRTLSFYDYPLGELTFKSEKGLKEALRRLDEAYLTPRTLAGIGVNDAEAISRYNAHETLAAPMREALAEILAKKTES